MTYKIIDLSNLENPSAMFGSFDENIKLIEKLCGVSIVYRDGALKIGGDDMAVETALRVIRSMEQTIAAGGSIDTQEVRYLVSLKDDDESDSFTDLKQEDGCICITQKGRPVKPKTLGQKKYVDAIENNTVVLGVGPAGTGKTYLAVAEAVRAFKAKQVARIILTRPAVEAGEKLGFLPGDLQQKIDPYLRPLYDALFDMLGSESFQKQQEKGAIEIAPLAYMRGRTLDDSFIILDEAQNTTKEQMKMFLTRLGFNSKMVVTGDVTQIDLPDGKTSGLTDAMRVLKSVDDISIVKLTQKDVVRHHLVQEIVKAYEKAYERTNDKTRRKGYGQN